MEEGRGYGGRGFRGREGRSFAMKPVEIGQEYDVDIQELSGRGEGVARVQGLVIFVKDTKPNDHVKVKITRISSRFAEGEVVKQVEKVEEQQPQEESQPEE